jgi:hypothetical protein
LSCGQHTHSPEPTSISCQHTHSPEPTTISCQHTHSPEPTSISCQHTHSPEPTSISCQHTHSPEPTSISCQRTHSPEPTSISCQHTHSPEPTSISCQHTHSPEPTSISCSTHQHFHAWISPLTHHPYGVLFVGALRMQTTRVRFNAKSRPRKWARAPVVVRTLGGGEVEAAMWTAIGVSLDCTPSVPTAGPSWVACATDTLSFGKAHGTRWLCARTASHTHCDCSEPSFRAHCSDVNATAHSTSHVPCRTAPTMFCSRAPP